MDEMVQEYIAHLHFTLARLPMKQIERVVEALIEAQWSRRTVYIFGNGGSAADAQHIAAEWIGRFNKDRRAIPAIALTTDTSILTAVANDYGFDQILARQIQGLGRKGDVAIALSTSGNSLNVLLAAEEARKMGLITVGLTGRDGGSLGAKVKYHLNVPHDLSARIQEVHIMVGHILCGLVENNVKGL